MYSRWFTVGALLIGWATTTAAFAQYDLSWFNIDGGGTTFGGPSGIVFEVDGTIGQPDAGPIMTGGGFELVGGFWNSSVAYPCAGDLDDDHLVTLIDLSVLLTHYGTSGSVTLGDGDFDSDGDVDLTDLALLLSNYGTTCQ